MGSISGLGKFPGGGYGNTLQYFCLENPHAQRSLEGYSRWGWKKLDTTEQLSTLKKQNSPTNTQTYRYNSHLVNFLSGTHPTPRIPFHKIYKTTSPLFQLFSESVPYHMYTYFFFLKQNSKQNDRPGSGMFSIRTSVINSATESSEGPTLFHSS